MAPGPGSVVSRAERAAGEGGALGLAIRHSSVEAHGGEALTVESEPGRGSTFRMILPSAAPGG
jgi:two-component system sensor histidine kinase BaeS